MIDNADNVLEGALESQQPTPEGQEGTISTGAEDTALEAAPKVEQTEEDKKFASKFAALARKEKAIRDRERQIANANKQAEERIKELEAKLAEMAAPKVVPKRPLEERLWENPFEALAEEGLDYETLTRTALADGKLPVEIQVKRLEAQMKREFDAKIEALRKERDEEKSALQKEREEAEKKQRENQESQAISSFKSQISEHIEGKKEDLQLLAMEGESGMEQVYSLIAEDAQRQKEEAGDVEIEIEIMSIEEAASKVEERLLNRAKDFTKLSKIQALFGGDKAKAPTGTKLSANSPTTLSNQQSQVQGPVKRHMSEQDFLREVANSIKFQAD